MCVCVRWSDNDSESESGRVCASVISQEGEARRWHIYTTPVQCDRTRMS